MRVRATTEKSGVFSKTTEVYHLVATVLWVVASPEHSPAVALYLCHAYGRGSSEETASRC